MYFGFVETGRLCVCQQCFFDNNLWPFLARSATKEEIRVGLRCDLCGVDDRGVLAGLVLPEEEFVYDVNIHGGRL